MTITVEWGNPEQSVVRTDINGRWTWEEFQTAVDQSMRLIQSVAHPVYLVNVIDTSSISPGGNALPHFRQFIGAMPPNHRLTIMVNMKMEGKLLASIFRRAVPMFSKTLVMAESVEEAYRLIERHEQQSP